MIEKLGGFTALFFSLILQIFIGFVLFKLSVEYDGDLGKFFRFLFFLFLFWEIFHIGYNFLLFYATIR